MIPETVILREETEAEKQHKRILATMKRTNNLREWHKQNNKYILIVTFSLIFTIVLLWVSA